jgi:hypothetical protein
MLAILDAVEIHSPERYTLLGEPRDIPGGGSSEGVSAVDVNRLVVALQSDLYSRLYIRPSERPRTNPADEFIRRDFVAALSAANTGRGAWEPGWTVSRIDDGGDVVVAKDGVEFWIPAEGVRASLDEIRPGETCRVWVAKERRELIPSFYLAIGDHEGETSNGEHGVEPVDRYFWHLTAPAAVPFMSTVTSLLNQSQIPFSVKVLSNPSHYHRADAGVLYLQRRLVRRAAPIIARIYAAISSGLRPNVPLLTKRLAAGLAFAEDPAGSASFGQHRCRVVAVALWESFLRGEIDRDARAATMAGVFSREGLDALRPYLGAGSRDENEPEPLQLATSCVQLDSNGLSGDESTAWRGTCPGSQSPLEAALTIGGSLCASAFWDRTGGLCNWMGRSRDEVSEHGGAITPTSAALGPELYGGSAGVALFLAQLHATSGDPVFRRAALGAIRRSMCRLDPAATTRPGSALSFFAGDLGVAFAARRVGVVLGEADPVSRAQGILDQVVESCTISRTSDLLGSSAQAIPALLESGRTCGSDPCFDLAISLGEELCRSALRQDDTCRWDLEPASGPAIASIPRNGLSHGTAQIGVALFELYAATGQRDFLETARGSFAYEDSVFDLRRGSRVDLRPAGLPGVSDPQPSFVVPWRGGAAEIALSRLRAASLDPNRADDYLATARIAIGTIVDEIDENLEDPSADASLASGLAGLLEIILIAGRMLDEPSYRERAADVAQILIDRHAAAGDWPSGVPSGGPNPSLMLGTAGIGYTFLRLHDPASVPSILLFIPCSERSN